MCGRIALFTPPARLARYFEAELEGDLDRTGQPVYNVGPTTDVYAARTRGRPGTPPTRVLELFRWGLVPSWAADLSAGNRRFNARAESVATTPAFRGAFASRRALVAADGFYEWRRTPAGRQPHYFERSDGEPMAFAGLYEFWRDRTRPDDASAWVRSCTIITAAAGPDSEEIHDRVPVVMDPDSFDVWLDPDNDDRPGLESLLHAAPPGTLRHHPVDPKVGNVRNDSPELTRAYEPPAAGPSGGEAPPAGAQPELPLRAPDAG
ncbi:MAG TPA: SOS response-associated peptidase [Acidimicrobiales bacterium]|nr:SOS response-associated peptidase [Acidimicrobiales bacterium]